MHPRKEVRAAIVALLKTPEGVAPAQVFPTSVNARWYDSRDTPTDTRLMPVGVVYTANERLDPDYRHDGGVRRRIMTMRIEAYHTGDEAAEGVDLIAWEVENLLHANPTIGNKVESCRLETTEIAFAEAGDVSLFAAVMEWEVVYYTHVVVDDGDVPKTVLLGFDPETGPGNEDDYTVIIGGG